MGFSLRGEKDRFVLPPAFRKLVRDASDGQRVLCLAKHDRWPCLTGFGLSRIDEFADQIDREEGAALARGVEFDRDLRATQLYGFSEVPFDESGRFVLPEFLGQLGEIAGQAFFQGGGPFFTIWNPEALMAMGSGWEAAQAGCRALAAEASSGGRARR
ncbi:division/cell wall cluster transcriptional repressor MraZ [Novosphingobium tardum]|uniref:Division/cell wall cluster transcriptional repressor MraZ n=1 Tax=Novosphingobium tardum TaxID=1538021 RepID=A0ABV8RMR2_9SPHN